LHIELFLGPAFSLVLLERFQVFTWSHFVLLVEVVGSFVHFLVLHQIQLFLGLEDIFSLVTVVSSSHVLTGGAFNLIKEAHFILVPTFPTYSLEDKLLLSRGRLRDPTAFFSLYVRLLA